MKLVCECGNEEAIESDVIIKKFELRNCGDGSMALVCKTCNKVVFIKNKENSK